ncbi:Ig-like domain-containing protein [Pseudomonas yamanorum]|uniref:Ig-like domain-containing protein n=1 Tax=Pseudomonas yamanorum TaxID=515393 RepID=UPI00087B74D6|nr:Ig-like domain-containing protein [Pseudomonas yamanorum]SDT99918.1 Ig-like domain (group 3) [Pseudomonas yamanorum]
MSAIKVAIINGKIITEAAESSFFSSSEVLRIKAVLNGKYVISDGELGLAPKNITIKRVRKDLHVALDGSNPDNPQLIIEGFFDAMGQLIGVDENGVYQEYIVADREKIYEGAFLMDGASSFQELGTRPVSGVDGLTAESPTGRFWPALLGLSSMALAGAIHVANRGSNKESHVVGYGDPPSPQLDRVQDSVGQQIGLVQNGGVTDDSTPTFSGSGTPGSTILIKDGDTLMGESVVNKDGIWEFVPEWPLSNGEHSIVFIEKNTFGKESHPSPNFVLIIDLVAPVQPRIEEVMNDVGLIVEGGFIDDSTPTLKGVAEPGSVVEVYANGELIGSVITIVDGRWSFTPLYSLVNGSYSFTTISVDAAGNRGLPSLPYDLSVGFSESGGLVITGIIDHTGEAVGDSNVGGITDDNLPTVVGQAFAYATVKIYDHGILIGTAQADTNGRWAFTPKHALEDGLRHFTATLVNSEGGESAPSAFFEIEIDTIAPNNLGGLSNGGLGEVTDNSTPTFTGTAEAFSTVIIFDNDVEVTRVFTDVAGRWSFTPMTALADGAHSFRVVNMDAAGNQGPKSEAVEFNLETGISRINLATLTDNAGSVVGTVDKGGITDDTTPTLSGQATANCLVNIYNADVLIGSTTSNYKGEWSFTPSSALIAGNYAFAATVVTLADGESVPTDTFDICIEASAPGGGSAGEINEITDDVGFNRGPITNGGFTDDATPTLNGSNLEPGSTVSIKDNGVAIGKVIVGNDGKWTFTSSLSLEEGEHNFTIEVTDLAGNVLVESDPYTVIIDTELPSKPVITSIVDDQGDHTGNLLLGGLTDDAQPQISGTAEASSTVILYDRGLEIGRVPAGADGNWTFTPALPLADGGHFVTVRSEDKAGNSSVSSEGFQFDILTGASPTAPMIVAVIDNIGDQQGNVSPNGLTDDKRPTVKGTGTPDTTVQVYADGKLVGFGMVGADGQWSVELTTDLVENVNNISATITNAAGNTSPEAISFPIILDTSTPEAANDHELNDDVGVIRGALNDGDTTDDNRPTFIGNAEACSIVIIFDNDNEIGSVVSDATGRWAFTPNAVLVDGEHYLSTIVVDAVGNKSPESGFINFNVDTRSVVIKISSVMDNLGSVVGAVDKGGITDDTTPTLSGQATANCLVNIYNADVLIGSTTSNYKGEWSFTPSSALIAGNYAFAATVVTLADGESVPTDTFDICIEASAPGGGSAGEINEITDDVGFNRGPITNGGFTDDATPTLNGSNLEPGSTVSIKDNGVAIGKVIVGNDGKWTFTSSLSLEEGEHNFTIEVTDLAGNVLVESDPYTVIIDTELPSKPVITSIVDDQGDHTGNLLLGGLTDDAQPQISGTAEASSTVILYDRGLEIGRVPAGADGNWTFTPALPLADGGHFVTVRSEDKAGNSSVSSEGFQFDILTGASPTAPMIVAVIDNIEVQLDTVSSTVLFEPHMPIYEDSDKVALNLVFSDILPFGVDSLFVDNNHVQVSVTGAKDLTMCLNDPVGGENLGGRGNLDNVMLGGWQYQIYSSDAMDVKQLLGE